MSKPVVRITIEVYDDIPGTVKFEQLHPTKLMKGRYLELSRKALRLWWKLYKRDIYRKVREEGKKDIDESSPIVTLMADNA